MACNCKVELIKIVHNTANTSADLGDDWRFHIRIWGREQVFNASTSSSQQSVQIAPWTEKFTCGQFVRIPVWVKAVEEDWLDDDEGTASGFLTVECPSNPNVGSVFNKDQRINVKLREEIVIATIGPDYTVTFIFDVEARCTT